MTTKSFFNKVSNSHEDILQEFIDLLHEKNIDYCLVGGLAVNAYVEPVISLDMDLIVAAKDLDKLQKMVETKYVVKTFEHSLNFKSPKSNLRIQIQTDPRYQTFVENASLQEVMGYRMKVASLENVLQGKIWAYLDETRRKSKRQKDLADILRLVESYPNLKLLLPDSMKSLT